MAAKTPNHEVTDTNYLNPARDIPAFSASTVPNAVIPKLGLFHRCYYFADVDASDTWTPGANVPTIVCVAWTPDTVLDPVAVGVNATGTAVNMAASNANSSGWLHVWSHG